MNRIKKRLPIILWGLYSDTDEGMKNIINSCIKNNYIKDYILYIINNNIYNKRLEFVLNKSFPDYIQLYYKLNILK